MDTVDLLVRNNESFVFIHEVTAWSQLYELDLCAFKSQMRSGPNDPLVLYEWSFVNNNLTIYLKPATGTLSFATNPSAGNTVTIGATFITFVESGAVGNQVNIGGDVGETVTNFMAFAAASTDAAIASCTYSQNGTLVTLTFKKAGGLGNSLALSSNSANIVASGETLVGGVAAVEMMATRPQVRRFEGKQYYDFKLYFEGQEVVMFGGDIEFIGGVTL